jgi:hypothetical protein
VHIALPNHLRPRRQKIFGPAPAWPLDRHAKACIWAAAHTYNLEHRQKGQHIGPLTWATLRVLKALLWGFHDADGSGRCFPKYETIAKVAKCTRSTVHVALRALERAGLLDWAWRIQRVWREETDQLLGGIRRVLQVVRTSNAYRLIAPSVGTKPCKSENPTGPLNREKKEGGARLDGARVMQEEPSQPPPAPPDRPVIAPQREHGTGAGERLSHTERAAIVARMDNKQAPRQDWDLYSLVLDDAVTSLITNEQSVNGRTQQELLTDCPRDNRSRS